MREVSDLEYRLRTSAVAPAVREEHFSALRGDLHARMRSRRHRPLITVVACAVLISAVVFQEQPLESFNHHFNFFDSVGDSVAVFMTHDDSPYTMTYTVSTNDGHKKMSASEMQAYGRKYERIQELHMIGDTTLKAVTGITFRGQTEFDLEYAAMIDGEEMAKSVMIGQNDSDEYLRFLKARYAQIYLASSRGEIPEMEQGELVLDDYQVRFHKWRIIDPEFGEIVLWRGLPVN